MKSLSNAFHTLFGMRITSYTDGGDGGTSRSFVGEI